MKFKQATLAIFIITLLTTLSSFNIQAQAPGRVRGVVTDARGAAVAGARVVLLLAGKRAVRETATDNSGQFYFGNVRPGDYTIMVEAKGLTQTGGAEPIQIPAGGDMQGVIALTVAAIEDALVVSASRTEASLRETPASAFIVSADDLRRAQRVTVFDALRSSPGVTVMQTARRGGVTSIFVRGGESDYTKVLIDGVPANDAGGQFDFADLTTDNAARVELVRGAQGAIYGSDAMAGVLQLFTHRGTTATPAFELTGEGGSFAYQRQLARLSGANGPFDYSLSFTHLHTNGRDRNDDYQNEVASANLGYRFNTRTQLRVTARNENSGNGVPGATLFLFPDPDERIERRRIAIGATLDDQTTKTWHQRLAFVYAENNQLSFDPAAQDLTNPATPLDTASRFNDFADLFNNHQRRRGLRYQTDFQLNNFILAGSQFISAGVDYEQERGVFDSGFAGANRVAVERTNLGGFVQDQFTFTPRILVTAGIRWENNRANVPASLAQILNNLGSAAYTGEVGFGTVVVPKLAATIFLREPGLQSRRGPTRLRANYGEGIKAPTLLEAFSPSPFFLGNPALRAERARSFDVGLEQFFLRDRYRVEVIYFDNRFRDQIDFRFGAPFRTADTRLTNFINYNRTRARGGELIFDARPVRRLSFGGSYTFLNSELLEALDPSNPQPTPSREQGLPLLRRPRHSGTFNFAWIDERYDLTLLGFFVGRRRDNHPVTGARFDAQGPLYNAAYQRFDLAGSLRLTSWVSLFGRIENLLNQDYEEVLGYPAYRLNFAAGMRFRIGGGR
jgi:vitamin B12 transporter